MSRNRQPDPVVADRDGARRLPFEERLVGLNRLVGLGQVLRRGSRPPGPEPARDPEGAPDTPGPASLAELVTVCGHVAADLSR